MNYVEQLQTLTKEDAMKSVFSALTSKALDAISEVKAEMNQPINNTSATE